METKREIRRNMLAVRDALPKTERAHEEVKINQYILESTFFKEAHTLFAFASYGSETDIFSLVNRAFQCGKRVCFPLVAGEGMEFHEVRAVSELHRGFKGILEPAAEKGSFFIPEKTENVLMLMPGVCFDEKGGRIGYGGGFYDRYLSGCRKKGQEIVTVAPAYKCQLLRAGIIPKRPHDIAPDYIVTMDGIMRTALP